MTYSAAKAWKDALRFWMMEAVIELSTSGRCPPQDRVTFELNWEVFLWLADVVLFVTSNFVS